MASKFSHVLISIFLFSIQPFISQSRTLKPERQTFSFLQNMEEVHKGQTVSGLNEVKKYLSKFGYLPHLSDTNLDNNFDDTLESALLTYQKYHRLNLTGKLDSDTIKKMMVPRCGVPDITNLASWNWSSNPFTVSLYSFPENMPRWSNYELTYTFGSSVPDNQDVRSAFRQALNSWEGVTQFKFQEASDGELANAAIGFYSGEHGDGVPFDGRGGVLAHTFYPQNGQSHFDSDESWSTNPDMNQMDLQSVALHEFGHLLGLAHTQDPNAVMYPSIGAGTLKRDLTQDDIDGIQALYSN